MLIVSECGCKPNIFFQNYFSLPIISKFKSSKTFNC